MFINNIFRCQIKSIHFIGIGGIGMSGIARALLSLGFKVTGSDIKENQEILRLREDGAKIFIGHEEKNVHSADAIVFSSAITDDNAEILAAKALTIPLIPRALMLAELMKLRCGIAIAGSHGKTTTTSLIGTLMHEMGFEPMVIIGGIVNRFHSNALLGQGPFLVAEADESDGTFLHLSPTISVITNIDHEHLDFYENGIEDILQSFFKFTQRLPFYGLVVACVDDENVKNLLPKINRRIKTYGFSNEADYQAKNIETKGLFTNFDLYIKNEFIYTFNIHMAGLHNVLNSLAAIIVLEELGIKAKNLSQALASFCGVKRRFSLVDKVNNIQIIDDYAHHPTEIRAVINAAKRSFPKSSIKVLFQPHRYSRTKDLMADFAKCFLEVDFLCLTDIYSAQEKPIDGVNSQALLKLIHKETLLKPVYAHSLDEAAFMMANAAAPNDVILVLGAGNITNAGPVIVNNLHKKYADNEEK